MIIDYRYSKVAAQDAHREIVMLQFFVLRRLIGEGFRKAGLTQEDAYVCSLSAKTIVYKGQLMPTQVRD